MSSQLEITKAFTTHLSTFVNDWPVSWPNVDFSNTAESFLEMFFLPADTNQATLGTAGVNEDTGIVQVNVMYVEKNGTKDPYTKADELIEHFKRGTILTSGAVSVTITKATIAPPQTLDTHYQIPVSIYYRAYTEN